MPDNLLNFLHRTKIGHWAFDVMCDQVKHNSELVTQSDHFLLDKQNTTANLSMVQRLFLKTCNALKYGGGVLKLERNEKRHLLDLFDSNIFVKISTEAKALIIVLNLNEFGE